MAVERSDRDVLGAHGDAPAVGNRKAALLLSLLARVSDDLGIDQLDGLALLNLDYHDAAQNADLRSRKTDTVGISHGFEHIVQKRQRPRRDRINGTADLAKRFISDFYNVQFCHNSFSVSFDIRDPTVHSEPRGIPIQGERDPLPDL